MPRAWDFRESGPACQQLTGRGQIKSISPSVHAKLSQEKHFCNRPHVLFQNPSMPSVRVLICVRRPPDVPLPRKGSRGGLGDGSRFSLVVRAWVPAFPRLSPSCRSLLACLQINASRTLCALHPILPTSFASIASSLSCLRIVLPTPENRNVRSARNRSGTREHMKSPTLTSALPGHHVEDNLVPPVAAPAPGDQTYQMQVRMSPIDRA